MKELFIVFPRIEAVNFNANAGAYIAGVPQPTAICGLATALCLSWARARPGELEYPLAEVVYGVQAFSGFSGQSRNPCSMSSQRGKVSAPMTDRPRASMQFGLVLRVTLATDETPSDADFLPFLQEALEALRLSGASLWLRAPIVTLDDAASALQRLPADTFVLSDESELLQAWLSQPGAPAVGEALALLAERPKDREVYKPRYVPAVLGVRRFEEPSNLPGSKQGLPHAYGEPVMGLARFRTVGSVRRAYRGSTEEDTLEQTMPDGTTVEVPVLPAVFWHYPLPAPEAPDLHLVRGLR